MVHTIIKRTGLLLFLATASFGSAISNPNNLTISSGSGVAFTTLTSPTTNVIFDSNTVTVNQFAPNTAIVTPTHVQMSTISISSTSFSIAFTNTVFAVIGATITIPSFSTTTCFWWGAQLNSEGTVAAKNSYFTLGISTPGAVSPFNMAGPSNSQDLAEQFFNTGGDIIIAEFSMFMSSCPAVTGNVKFNIMSKVDSGGTGNMVSNAYIFGWAYR